MFHREQNLESAGGASSGSQRYYGTETSYILERGEKDTIETRFIFAIMFASASAAADNITPNLASLYMFFVAFYWWRCWKAAGQNGPEWFPARKHSPTQHNTLFPQMLSVSYATVLETEISDFCFFFQVEEKRQILHVSNLLLFQGRTGLYSSHIWLMVFCKVSSFMFTLSVFNLHWTKTLICVYFRLLSLFFLSRFSSLEKWSHCATMWLVR